MDVATELIRKVVRGFYDNKATIVMEALLVHHVLNERELISLMDLPAKNLRAICARLKEDHLIKEVIHKDEASGNSLSSSSWGAPSRMRSNQTFYFVHFTEAVDAIKWKIHSIENKLKQEMDAQHNPQDYVCDVCKTRYKTIDAVQLFDPMQGIFECEVCKNPLREDDGPAPDDNAQDKMGELMVQLRPFIETLRKIDGLVIPENSFQHELQQALPIPAEGTKVEQVATHDDLPVASSKLPAAAQPEFKVHITTEAERSQQASAEAAEKLRLKEENALPSWHVDSTVNKSSFSGGVVKGEPEVKSEPNASGVVKEEDTNATDAMAEYYKKLQQQQQQQQQQAAENDDDDDDDDDEFEDVI